MMSAFQRGVWGGFSAAGGGRAGGGELDVDGGALAGGGLDAEGAAEHFDALAHAEEAESIVGGGGGDDIDIEAVAVIGYLQGDSFFDDLDGDGDAVGIGMAGDVDEGFLDDAEENGEDLGGGFFDGGGDFKAGADSGFFDEGL